jgi:flagellar biosynthetic protein FliS
MGAIHVTHNAHVSVVTIDDAERYNAMSLSMWIALKEAFDAIEGNPDVRAVILRGAGDKAFVSGANISEFETQRNSEASVAHYNHSVAQAQGHLTHGKIQEKGKAIARASRIVVGLQGALDFTRGGELAQNLNDLYNYVTRRLIFANAHNDMEALKEVQHLMSEIRSAWAQLPTLLPQQAQLH